MRADPLAVEAAFIRNFTHYVTWPDNAFSDEQTPWKICVLGQDPFGDVLERTFEGRIEQGRPYSILRADDPAELDRCQIVYVAYQAGSWRRAALERLKQQPVLTVSNAPSFLQEGGMIRFEVNDFVQLSVNLDSARQASLAIQTKVLEVAKAVIENGRVHRVR